MKEMFTKLRFSIRPNKMTGDKAVGHVATIAGLAVLAAFTSPVFAAPDSNREAAGKVSASALNKLSPELREVVAGNSAAPQDFLRTARAIKLGTAPAAGTMRVMVRTSGSLLSRETRLLLAKSGAKLGRTFARSGMQVIDATPEQLAVLAGERTVLSISPDSPTASTAAKLDVNARSVGVPEALGIARRLNSGPINGRGVTVAVLDSGIAPVGDLAGRIVGFKDFVNGADSTPYDDYGHGTHVAGVVAGSGAASSGDDAKRTYRGIAPGAKIVGGKVLGAEGQGTVSDAIAGIEWCIENKAVYNIRVINLSLGTKVRESYKTDPLCQAAERAVAAGIVVVATAGNRGAYTSINSPGNDPAVITVGASNSMSTARRSDDVITSYTSRGPSAIDATMKPDLVAPGNRVVSLRAPGSWIDTKQSQTTVPTSEYSKATGESAYTRLSGSSMAAPAVAGAAALLLQANPGMTPNAVKAALMVSAQLLSGKDPLKGTTGAYDPFTQGAGALNLPGALNVAIHYRPGVGLMGAPHTTSKIAGERFRWSIDTIRHRWRLRNAVPTTLLSGPSLWATLGSSSVWTDALVWGGSISMTRGNGIAIIQNAIWGTAGDNVSWNTGGDAPTAFQAPENSNVSWNTGGDNVSWNTGGDSPLAFATPEEDNVSWNTGGDNVSWNTGGDSPSWSTDSIHESAFAAPDEDNVSWNTGGDNVSWNTGGDAPVSSLLVADNVSWNTGGDAPFKFAEGDLPTPEEANVSWNTGGD